MLKLMPIGQSWMTYIRTNKSETLSLHQNLNVTVLPLLHLNSEDQVNILCFVFKSHHYWGRAHLLWLFQLLSHPGLRTEQPYGNPCDCVGRRHPHSPSWDWKSNTNQQHQQSDPYALFNRHIIEFIEINDTIQKILILITSIRLFLILHFFFF